MSALEIPDVSGLEPRGSFLTSNPEPLDSGLLIQLEHERNADGSEDLKLTGHVIELAPGGAQHLFESLNVDRGKKRQDPREPRVDVRRLTIACDTLELAEPLNLPETEVTIFARRLIVGDKGAVDTSPLPFALEKGVDATAKSPAEPGADGRKGGDLALFLRSIEAAEGRRTPVFVCDGGRGQDPGLGRNGSDGNQLENFGGIVIGPISAGPFKPPAVFVTLDITEFPSTTTRHFGVDQFPKDGTDALAAGRPGDGGDAGAVRTSVRDLAARVRGKGQPCGAKGPDYVGGKAGTPIESAKYTQGFALNYLNGKFSVDPPVRTDTRSAKAGKDRPAPDAAKKQGRDVSVTTIEAANAWVHPEQLHIVLRFARRLFLAGENDAVVELLEPYVEAMRLPMPAAAGAWRPEDGAFWSSAGSELASMLSRARSGLDYFGNRGGFTPFFSLGGSIQLFQQEARRALHVLMLSSWVRRAESRLEADAGAIEATLAQLDEDSAQAIGEIVAAEAKLRGLEGPMNANEKQLTEVGIELEKLGTRLRDEAKAQKELEALIKFELKLAAAATQVFPMGQPAVRTLGNFASLAADLVGDDDIDIPKTVAKFGKVAKEGQKAIQKARKLEQKAEEARKKAKAKAKPGDKKAALDQAKSEASYWETAGEGLGDAVDQVSQAIGALQVSERAVDAAFAKLAARDERWNELNREIKRLNRRKVTLYSTLVEALSTIAESHARLSSNAATAQALRADLAADVARMSPQAARLVAAIDDRARIRLLKQLYLMVRSYETTVLEPLDGVNWELDTLIGKLGELFGTEQAFDPARFEKLLDALQPIFEENLSRVREQLQERFDFAEKTLALEAVISREHTPELLEELEAQGAATLDPIRFGLLLPHRHHARYQDFALTALEFDPDGPAPPDNVNVVVRLRTGQQGIIRHAAELYSIHSDAPPTWEWTRLPSGQIRAGERSPRAEDLLAFVLGEGSERLKQKVSSPPVWSDLELELSFSPELAAGSRPRIARLTLEVTVDGSDAPASQRVLTVQGDGRASDAVVSCSPDLRERGAGFGTFLRIYEADSAAQLSLSEGAADEGFLRWDLLGPEDSKAVGESGLELRMTRHAFARHVWRGGAESAAAIPAEGLFRRPELLDEAAEVPRARGVGARPAGALATGAAARWIELRPTCGHDSGRSAIAPGS